ncbi:hypothetical protein N9Y50_04485, partial [Alphaproteobacteria bacterium]|nr:hypothetical protein [Alphaproteobacteria bacterium]
PAHFASAAYRNSTQGADVAACVTTGANMMANNGDCRATPSKYEVGVFEMGVCTAHPFTSDGTKTDLESMDRSTCTTTFLATDQTNGSVVDIANVIGGSIDLVGTSTRPGNGTYGFPYIILREKFTVGKTIAGNDGNTYYGLANGSVDTTGPAADYDDNLRNFGPPGYCYSGYVGATIPIGTIDAFLTNSSLQRGDETTHYDGSANCTRVGKLVGVINLTTPFTIDQNTQSMQFNFVVTNYGINMGDNDNDGYPDDYGSGPFSGTFTLKTVPQQ